MFGLSDLFYLIISAFIILPVVAFMREFSYLVAGAIIGIENPRVTIGSGRKLFLVNLIGFGQLDFRRNYHLYSWFSFDQLKREGKFAYIFLYASPIVFSTTIGLILNALLANGYLDTYATFFDRFIFYLFFYVLFDAVPMTTVNGKPNNGKIIFDMLLHGKRTDPNLEDFIPSTSNVDEIYEEIKQDLEDIKKI